MAADRVPGLALAITRGDEVIYLKGYGTAGNGKPMTPHTQLYIASLSKGFTALAVMQLVEEGKIGLDEPVRTYLPDFAATDQRLSDRITVRELLNQTSGLADEDYGVVLLYDRSYALADYAGTRRGLLDLLVSKRPDNGGLGASKVGVIIAALALVTTTLQVYAACSGCAGGRPG